MALTLGQVDEYIIALMDNAEKLVCEADLLFRNKAYARTYTLAHIAREELSKCIILYAAGRRAISGEEVDWKSTLRRLRDHKSKIRQEVVENALTAAALKEEELSDYLMLNVNAFAKHRNNQKNLSIYVGFEDGKLLAPSESITKQQAERTLLLAKMGLDKDRKIYTKIGRFTDMDPTELGNLPKFSLENSEDIKNLLKHTAPAYAEVLDKLNKEN